MKYQVGVIFFSFFISACVTKPRLVESPLFNTSAPPETKEELESLPKITQAQVIEKMSNTPDKPTPQPRTVMTPNRRAPTPRQEIMPAVSISVPEENVESQDYVIYTAKGGEQLSFVARSLLGSPQKTSLLRTWNPNLTTDRLKSGQEVKVKAEALKPQPIYLSRSLIIKFKTQLYDHLENKSPQKTYVVKTGDTLQTISQQFYSTTRRWTELYLLNHDRLKNPDSLEKDTELKHY